MRTRSVAMVLLFFSSAMSGCISEEDDGRRFIDDESDLFDYEDAGICGDLDGDGQPAPAWGDGAEHGGAGLDGLAPIPDGAAPMDPLGDAMAGPPDPMSGGDPLGGAPAFDGAMAAMDGAAAANIAEGMDAANAASEADAAAADAPQDDAPTDDVV